MKKAFKKCTSLLLLLTLLTTIKPIVPIPQPGDNESGITILSDDDNPAADEIITTY